MKKIILSAALALVALGAMAQHPFVCSLQGAKLHYTNLDARGNESGATEIVINEVSGDSQNFTITQTTRVIVNGASITKPIQTTSTIKDGDVTVDFGGGLSMTGEGNGYVLPTRMAVGLELPTGEATVEMSGMKFKQNTTFHKVVGREELEVPAGTFNCFVVERQYTAKALGMKVAGSMKTWYARGIGTVKMETYDKNGKVQSAQVLSEIYLPAE